MVLEVDSTEDVLNALLEYLVDPRLPFKSSVLKKAPTLSQQQSVATQFMDQSDPTASKDMNNDLSMAEKAIQDACNISCALDALRDIPSIKNG
ncbi:hypothetical protein CQW23_16908 [Capsicum baccatum]|uniref:DUF7913 domain-containing protein n=1 Tax=Capsicum baccatum TaxID=33114 RepID=A0A2G2WCA0_CAPBA|nr:hypothetical protein CQW23_16908 [Capsicum baccatum]